MNLKQVFLKLLKALKIFQLLKESYISKIYKHNLTIFRKCLAKQVFYFLKFFCAYFFILSSIKVMLIRGFK